MTAAEPEIILNSTPMSSTQTKSPLPTSLDTEAVDSVDIRAQKRVEIGLNPQRPTATTDLQRPPDRETSKWLLWSLVVLMAGSIAVILMLVVADMTGSPILLPWDANESTKIESVNAPAIASGYREIYATDFSDAPVEIAGESRPGRRIIGPDFSRQSYEMLVWPDHMAWATLGTDGATPYRIETQVTIAEETPGGYGGIITRFRDGRDFVAFVVDGQGRYRVQTRQEDVLHILVPWTESPSLMKSGDSNQIVVEDNGEFLRFLANGVVLYDVAQLPVAVGDSGITGGASSDDAASIVFDWVRFLGGMKPPDSKTD